VHDLREVLRAEAVKGAEFLQREMWDEASGTIYRSWRAGQRGTPGFAEDYACVAQAMLDLYGATFDIRWLQWAERLQDRMDALFWDEAGGYFNSPAGAEDIILRLKEDYDGAEPAPSSVAVMNELRLAALLGDETSLDTPGATLPLPSPPSTRRDRALRSLEAFRGRWAEFPHAMPQLLCALELALDSPRHVVIAGDPASAEFRALADVLAEKIGPHRTVLAADGGAGQAWLATRAPWLADMKPRAGQATAYVCENYTCQAPVTTPDALRALLKSTAPTPPE
jgi:uncharacterized protein YyaL (SSP411 family)